ncbi:winged helix DNA-binding protein [Sphingomonas sp. DT-204]|uniref:winged helix DNA-binding protein n=1 Tax=Sphingomonas sp. DT-204 TaxID=3396166 RepID=UPI003F1D6775
MDALHKSRREAASRPPVSFKPWRPLLNLARQVMDARAKCARYFPKGVFRDSAWDMMLELFIAGEERRIVCVKQLMAVSGESATGAMRRIDRLEEVRLIRRRPDPEDNRRVLVELTDTGREAMTKLLTHIFGANSQEPNAAV